MNSHHLTLDEIRACARGEDESLVSAAAEHCSYCHECAGNLAAALAIIEYGPRKSLWESVTWGQLAAVTVLLAALGFAAVATVSELLPAEPPSIEQQLAALATTETIDPMLVRIHLGIASPAGSDDTIARLQAAGFDLAEERYDRAISELETLHSAAPGSQLVAAYLGIARYLAGDDSPRVRDLLTLGASSDNSSVSSFATWYLGNAQLRAGEIQNARQTLSRISHLNALPGRLSKRLLDQLQEIDP